MFPPPVCPTHPSSIWSFASPLCLWLRTMRWQQIRRQEILLSIKLAILPARMTYMLPLAWPLCQRSLPRRCSLKMKAPSFSSFQAKHLPYMLLFHSGDSLQQATQRSSQASRAFGLEELLQEREREKASLARLHQYKALQVVLLRPTAFTSTTSCQQIRNHSRSTTHRHTPCHNIP